MQELTPQKTAATPALKQCRGRRTFLSAAAGVAASAVATLAGSASARDFGPNAAPAGYPDPDILVHDDRFKKYALGNTPILRLFHSKEMLWAEGPAWNGSGKYLVWSDIPNNVQYRWLEEDGHVSKFRHPSNNSNGNTFDFQVGRFHSNTELAESLVTNTTARSPCSPTSLKARD